MLAFIIKKNLAGFLEVFKFNDVALLLLNKRHKNNYIRVINYHETYPKDIDKFERHLAWYKRNFENCSLEKLNRFFNNEYEFKNKPGLIISFDDGYEGNYNNAYPLLKKYGFTGYFYISAGLVGQESYINKEQLIDLKKNNNVIGCHTYTHHRMDVNDSDDILKKEIIESKFELENMLDSNVDIFCWVGGEEKHYTKRAAEFIKNAGYKYSMMTNSEPVLKHTNHFSINRTNINDDWDLEMVKFQLSGLMDMKYALKRKRVNRITEGVDGCDKNDR